METIRTIIDKWATRQDWDEASKLDLVLKFINDRQINSFDCYLSLIAAREQHWTNAQIDPIERLIDCIPLENLKSWIVSLVQDIQEHPLSASMVVDGYVEMLQPLAENGAKTFEEWRKCPKCGEYCDGTCGAPEAELSGSYLSIVCWHCETTIYVFFRPTGEPVTELPF